MNKTQISKEFKERKVSYTRLGTNIVDALKTFLSENDIPYHDVYFRVKKFDSFFEKLDRKKYSEPFEDVEDICGVRIICYYASDIERINEIICNEFNVLEEQNKSDLLGLKEFAYRSQHYIVKINDSWLTAPNYRKLEGVKSEIQVRTILMHAWAEVEHKLNYKNVAQVPDKFQRKLFRLSAKFEEADEQFEELRDGINEYIEQLNSDINTSKKFDLEQDFNIESYKAFLKFNYPNDYIYDFHVRDVFDLYSSLGKNFKDIDNALKLIQPHLPDLSKDLKKNGYSVNVDEEPSEFITLSMDIAYDDVFEKRTTIESWRKVVEKWRHKLLQTQQ